MEYSDHSKGRYCFLVVLFHLDRCICESLYFFALDGSQESEKSYYREYFGQRIYSLMFKCLYVNTLSFSATKLMPEFTEYFKCNLEDRSI